MISNIRDAFSDLLDELEWMDEPTKQKAREKVRHTEALLYMLKYLHIVIEKNRKLWHAAIQQPVDIYENKMFI